MRWERVDFNREIGSSSIGKGGLLGMLGVGWQGGVRFVTNILIGNVAGAILLGLTATALSISQLIVLLWPAAAGAAASRFVGLALGRRDVGEMQKVAGYFIRRLMIFQLVAAVMSLTYWRLVERGSWLECLTVVLLTLGLAGWTTTRGILFGSGNVRRAVFTDVLTGAAGLVGLCLFMVFGIRSIVVLLPVACGYALYTILSIPRLAGSDFDQVLNKEIRRFVILGTVGTISSAGFLQLSLLAARHFAGLEGAGQYSASLTLATPLSLVAAGLSVVLYPTLARAWGGGSTHEFRRITDQATRVLCLALIGGLGVVVIVREGLVDLLWGPDFPDVVVVMPLLLAAVAIGGISSPSVSAITTRSEVGMRISAASSLSGALVGCIAWAIFGSLGVQAIAWGYVAGSLIIALVPIAVTWYRDGHAWVGLSLKVFAALLLVWGLSVLTEGTSVVVQVCGAVAFLGVWLALNRAEASLVLRGVSGRR
ncbi:lipopolysaccharide biosynthesis protein [Knoellia locipacati]|uniref:lipopolysaccharide biosynthesis protein n=1 Tax=Knoellia locipacati TaxID=882824 RepID=UPI0011BE0E08|nr:hypothetical protein [Knoellia locipacati]